MFDPHKNLVLGTITVAPSPPASGTTLSMSSGDATNFPDPAVVGEYNVTIWPASEMPQLSNAEIVRITVKDGAEFTITREQEDTSARTILVGDKIAITITKKVVKDIEDAVENIEDTMVDLDSEQTLINKIMDYNSNTFQNFPGASKDGWTASDDPWVYVSASSFKIEGADRTATYTKGTRLKFTQTTAKYAVVKSSSFSTDTTVNIAVNTDYTIANAAITSPYYSYQANPQGYPTWFSYTPTGPTNTTLTGRFAVRGITVDCETAGTLTGTPDWTTHPTLPITAGTQLSIDMINGVGMYIDAGAATRFHGITVRVLASATSMNLCDATTAGDQGYVSATKPITWAVNDRWAVKFSYTI